MPGTSRLASQMHLRARVDILKNLILPDMTGSRLWGIYTTPKKVTRRYDGTAKQKTELPATRKTGGWEPLYMRGRR